MKPPIETRATGLLANGVSGAWNIDVDESLSGPDRWFLQIDNCQFYLYCELKGPDVVKQICEYLDPGFDRAGNATARDDGLSIGSFGCHTVKLLRDDEFGDRYFFTVTGDELGSTMRFEVSGAALADFRAAISQVESDLFQ